MIYIAFAVLRHWALTTRRSSPRRGDAGAARGLERHARRLGGRHLDGWAGVSVDADGSVYLLAGNGTLDGAENFGSSVVRLSPELEVLDHFTPYNVEHLNELDLDLGSSGALLLPRSNLLVGAGKERLRVRARSPRPGRVQPGGRHADTADVPGDAGPSTAPPSSGICRAAR